MSYLTFMDKPQLSIVIVSWNSWAYLGKCLDSIFAAGSPGLEVILVDNDSKDQTKREIAEHYPQVRLISNPANLGYAKACNQGLKISSGDFILLLNPDTAVHPGALDNILQYMKNHPEVGAVGPQLVYPDGAIQASCRRFPNYSTLLWEVTLLSRLFPAHPLFGAWKMGDFNFQTGREVDQPMGAALMVKREVMDKIGVLDERFSMFFNDVDLCYRIKKAGFKTIFLPQARITHAEGASTGQRPRRMIWYSHWGFLQYLWKHHRSGLKILLIPLAGIVLLLGAPLRSLFPGRRH